MSKEKEKIAELRKAVNAIWDHVPTYQQKRLYDKHLLLLEHLQSMEPASHDTHDAHKVHHASAPKGK